MHPGASFGTTDQVGGRCHGSRRRNHPDRRRSTSTPANVTATTKAAANPTNVMIDRTIRRMIPPSPHDPAVSKGDRQSPRGRERSAPTHPISVPLGRTVAGRHQNPWRGGRRAYQAIASPATTAQALTLTRPSPRSECSGSARSRTIAVASSGPAARKGSRTSFMFGRPSKAPKSSRALPRSTNGQPSPPSHAQVTWRSASCGSRADPKLSIGRTFSFTVLVNPPREDHTRRHGHRAGVAPAHAGVPRRPG